MLRLKWQWSLRVKSNNRKIVITRSGSGNSKLKSLLTDFDVVEVPTIEILPINIDKLQKIIKDFRFTHLVFHSQNAIRIFFDEFLKYNNIEDLNRVKIYVVGKATKEALDNYGLKSYYPKNKFTGTELVKLIGDDDYKDRVIFLPHSDLTDQKLIDSYRELGEFYELAVYKSVIPERTKLDDDFTDITFTASSTFKNFVKMYGMDILKGKRIYSIGPVTTNVIKSSGIDIYRESEFSTIESLVKAIKES